MLKRSILFSSTVPTPACPSALVLLRQHLRHLRELAREVVALGGPSAEDHPDLFQLLERIDHGVDPDVPNRRY